MAWKTVLLVALLWPAWAAADSFDAARGVIRTTLAQTGVPSVAVAVACRGRVVWEEGFGWADREGRVPATAVTPYTLGSVSKPLTATLVMVLADQGRIALDRPLNDYLGTARLRARVGSPADATVRRVAQHVAGLPGYYETFYPDEPETPPGLDVVVDRYGDLVYPAGRDFHYTNLGYTLLGAACARVSGKEYAAVLRDEVLRPLGMSGSGVDLRPAVYAQRAVRYGVEGERLPDYRTSVGPASDVYASAHDLARFGLFHLKTHLPDQKAILTDRSVDAMVQATVPMGREKYGLGWRVQQDAKGRRHVFHGGAAAGVDTELTLLPDEQVCVVVLANRTRLPGAAAVSRAVTDAILAALLGGRADDFQPASAPAAPAPAATPARELVGSWVGVVHTPGRDIPATLSIMAAGRVEASVAGRPAAELRECRWDDAGVWGKSAGTVPVAAATRRPHDLQWELTLRGDALTGPLYAVGKHPSRGVLLGFWVELKREARR